MCETWQNKVFFVLQTTAAVKAHTDQHSMADTSGSPGHGTEQHIQSAGLQSPGSSVSPTNPALSLSVPTEANRKIFAGSVLALAVGVNSLHHCI